MFDYREAKNGVYCPNLNTGIRYENKCYFVDLFANLIAGLDLGSKQLSIESWLDEYEPFSCGLFPSVSLLDNYLILIPGRSTKLGVYDLFSKRMRFISLEALELKLAPGIKPKCSFLGNAAIGRNVYFWGYDYSYIIKYSIDTNTAEVVADIETAPDLTEVHGLRRSYFSAGYAVCDQKLFLGLSAKPVLISIDLYNHSKNEYDFEEKISRILCVTQKEDTVVFLAETYDEDLNIYHWNTQKGITDGIKVGHDSYNTGFWNCMEIDGYIFFIPLFKGHFYRYDFSAKTVEPVNAVMDKLQNWPDYKGGFSIGIQKESGDKLIFQTLWDHRWYEYIPSTDSIKQFYPVIADGEYKKRVSKFLTNRATSDGNLFFREEFLSLEDYLKYIQETDTVKN